MSTTVEINPMLASKLIIIIDSLDDNPIDMDEGFGWDNADDVYEFKRKLEEIRGPECLHCGISSEVCGCSEL